MSVPRYVALSNTSIYGSGVMHEANKCLLPRSIAVYTCRAGFVCTSCFCYSDTIFPCWDLITWVKKVICQQRRMTETSVFELVFNLIKHSPYYFNITYEILIFLNCRRYNLACQRFMFGFFLTEIKCFCLTTCSLSIKYKAQKHVTIFRIQWNAVSTTLYSLFSQIAGFQIQNYRLFWMTICRLLPAFLSLKTAAATTCRL